MKRYLVKVRRIEEWEDETSVFANTPEEAHEKISTLLEQGWSKVFGSNDGDCHECCSSVVDVQCPKCFASVKPVWEFGCRSTSGPCDCGIRRAIPAEQPQKEVDHHAS